MSTGDVEDRSCCPDLMEKLSAYHDGKYPEGSAEAEDIQEHMARCAHCAETLDDYRALSAAAKILRGADGDRPDIARMRSAVAKSLRRIVFVRRLAWTGAGLSAAAAVAAAIIALLLPATKEISSAPAVAGNREEVIRQIIAELKEKPADTVDDRHFDDIRRRLEEAGFAVEFSDASGVMSVRDEPDMSGAVLELRELFENAQRSREGRGIIRVDGLSP